MATGPAAGVPRSPWRPGGHGREGGAAGPGGAHPGVEPAGEPPEPEGRGAAAARQDAPPEPAGRRQGEGAARLVYRGAGATMVHTPSRRTRLVLKGVLNDKVQ